MPKEIPEFYDNEPRAFPSDLGDGLTIRQYYAAAALMGILTRTGFHYIPSIDAGQRAFEYADALIEFERKEKQK